MGTRNEKPIKNWKGSISQILHPFVLLPLRLWVTAVVGGVVVVAVVVVVGVVVMLQKLSPSPS